MGLDFISRPGEDRLKSAIELSTIQMDNMHLSDLDEFLLVLSNYYLYLSSQYGMLMARLKVQGDILNSKVIAHSSKISTGTATERRALVIATNSEVAKINNSLLEIRAQVSMLEPVLEAIKIKIDSLKRIYFRRTSDRRD